MSGSGATPSLWRHRAFMLLWGAQTISLFGSQISLLAIPLTAVLMLKAGAMQMGILTALGTAPTLLFGLWAGAWADRLRKRPLLVAADLARAALLATIPLAALLHLLHLGQLYAVTFLAGSCAILFKVAYASLLPAIIPAGSLVTANSRLEASEAIAGTAGPGLGGALVQAVTAPAAILADAISFVVSAVILSRMPHEEPIHEHADPADGVTRAIVEGWRFVVGNDLLRSLTFSSATFNLFDGLLFAVYVLYIVRGLGLLPAAVGVVFGLGSVGAFLGTLLASPLVNRIGLGRVLVAAIITAGLAELAIGLATGPQFLRLAILVAAEGSVQLSAIIYSVNSVSLRQAITSAALLGRVNATAEVIAGSTGPIGALVGGILGQTVGLRETVLIAGSGTLLSFLWVTLSPVRSLRKMPARNSGDSDVAVQAPPTLTI